MSSSLQWFGESWNSTINDLVVHTNVPVGVNCRECGDEFRLGDQGIQVPSIDESEELLRSYHLECFMECLIGLSNRINEEIGR